LLLLAGSGCAAAWVIGPTLPERFVTGSVLKFAPRNPLE